MNGQGNKPYQTTFIDRVVGIIVFIVLAVIVAAIVLRYQEIGPGVSKLHYYTLLTQAFGVGRGADVRMAGLPIGKIEDITLRKQGDVRVDIVISNKYREFITEGVRLRVASSVGLGALIGGAGLHLIPSDVPGELLEPGSFIETLQPIGLAETFSDVELNKMAANIKAILENLNTISATIGRSGDAINTSLENVAAITQELRDTVGAVSAAVKSAEASFTAWSQAGEGVQGLVAATEPEIRAASANAREASGRLNVLLEDLEQLVDQVGKVVAQLQEGSEEFPGMVNDSRVLIERANELTDRLNRHWLLGGAQQKEERAYLPSIHPIRDPVSQ